VGLSTKSLRRLDVKNPRDLSLGEIEAWNRIKAENPALYSPYFHVGYTQLVASLCPNVKVGILYDNEDPIVFLPFQNSKSGHGGFARPIGMPMTDYHGFIAAKNTAFDPFEFLEQCGIGAFHFSNLIDEAEHMSAYTQTKTEATMMTLPEGPEAWRAGRDSSYRRHLKSHRRRIRKAEEAYGPRRFEFKSQDIAVYDQLMAWKRQKFTETGKYDVLSVEWTRQLLKTLWDNQDGEKMNGLRCDMHALYFGETLAAVDLGLSDGQVFHSWIVAYNNEVQNLGPGIQLLEALIDACPELGYERLDLGAGTDGYKRHYASDPFQTSSGFLALRGPAGALSKIYGATESFGERKGGSLGRIPGKLRRRYSQIAACDESFSGRAKAMLWAVTSSSQ